MKKILVSAAWCLFLFTALMSCKKSNDAKPNDSYHCNTCATTPTALAENNSSSKGIYKGIIIGSSGTIEFNIMNGGTAISANMVIDGASVTLTSSVSWNPGRPYVAPFTGTINGAQASVTFSVNADGSEPLITTSSIPGHPNATLLIVKESSTALIECFEGTYHTTKPEDGTFNILLSRSLKLWGGISRKNGDTEINDVGGTISNNNILQDSQVIGNLNGDMLSGKFKDDNGSTVTFSGKRTL